MLKKISFILIAAILFWVFLPASHFAACATDTPHIIINGEVWMLDEDGTKLFLLPDTYYARINNIDELYYYISFNGVNGKVSKNVVSTTGYHQSAKGTTMSMGINEDYLEFVAINIKRSPELTSENVASIPTNESFTFIGEYPTQTQGVWYYIKYNQYYGYIKRERTTMPVLSIESFVPETNPDLNNNNQNDGNNNNDDSGILSGELGKELRILIIIGLAIPAVLILFLIFRPSKNRKYYD